MQLVNRLKEKARGKKVNKNLRNSNQIDARTFLKERNRNSLLEEVIPLGGFSSVDEGIGWSTLRSNNEPVMTYDSKEKRIEIDPTKQKLGDDSIGSPSDSENEKKASLERESEEESAKAHGAEEEIKGQEAEN